MKHIAIIANNLAGAILQGDLKYYRQQLQEPTVKRKHKLSFIKKRPIVYLCCQSKFPGFRKQKLMKNSDNHSSSSVLQQTLVLLQAFTNQPVNIIHYKLNTTNRANTFSYEFDFHCIAAPTLIVAGSFNDVKEVVVAADEMLFCGGSSIFTGYILCSIQNFQCIVLEKAPPKNPTWHNIQSL